MICSHNHVKTIAALLNVIIMLELEYLRGMFSRSWTAYERICFAIEIKETKRRKA